MAERNDKNKQIEATSLEVVIASVLQALTEAQKLADNAAQSTSGDTSVLFERRAFIGEVEMQLAFAVANTKKIPARVAPGIIEEKLREVAHDAASSAAKQVAEPLAKFASSKQPKRAKLTDKTVELMKEAATNLTSERFVIWAAEQTYTSLRQNVQRFVNDKGMVAPDKAQTMMEGALRKTFGEHPDLAKLVQLVGPDLLSATGLNFAFHLDQVLERLHTAFAIPHLSEDLIALEVMIRNEELAKLPPANIQSLKIKFHLSNRAGKHGYGVVED